MREGASVATRMRVLAAPLAAPRLGSDSPGRCLCAREKRKEVSIIEPESPAVTEGSVQYQELYAQTQQVLERDPSKTNAAWQEACSRLREIDISTSPTPEDFVKASALVSFLQECLVATAIRSSDFNG